MLQGMPAYAAVAEPRVHDQLTNVTYVEDWSAGNASFRLPQDARTVCYGSVGHGGCKQLVAYPQKLEAMGHTLASQPFGAVTQVLLVDPDDGSLLAVSDPRKDGSPAAY